VVRASRRSPEANTSTGVVSSRRDLAGGDARRSSQGTSQRTRVPQNYLCHREYQRDGRCVSPTPVVRLRGMRVLRLAGLAEAAEILGVTKRTALEYTKRNDFPEPLARLASGPVWDAADVETWGARHGPFRPGRPSKRSA